MLSNIMRKNDRIIDFFKRLVFTCISNRSWATKQKCKHRLAWWLLPEIWVWWFKHWKRSWLPKTPKPLRNVILNLTRHDTCYVDMHHPRLLLHFFGRNEKKQIVTLFVLTTKIIKILFVQVLFEHPRINIAN